MTRHPLLTMIIGTAMSAMILPCYDRPAYGQDNLSAQDASESSAPSSLETNDDGDPGSAEPDADSDKPAAPAPLTPEQEAEAERAKVEFDAIHQKMIDALTEMRSTYIHYQNEEDQTADARQRYRRHRDQFRKLMREAYDAADRLSVLKFDQEAIKLIGTTIHHREANDIYDASTLRGSVQLIDSSARQLFLFRAGARSAACVGDIELAKRIYETIGEEKMEDADRALLRGLDKIKEQWDAEVEAREEDKKKELPRVKFATTRGDFVVELFLDSAPSAVAHFIGLVEDGFYDELDFFQVIEHLLALTGDPSGNGTGNSGQFLMDEHTNDGARHGVRGALVMAKMPIGESGTFIPHSGSSQFAILFLPVTTVSERQTVFGRVIEGMDVVSSLRRVDPSKKDKKNKMNVPPDRILTAEVIRRPETLPEPRYVDLQEAVSEAQRHHEHEHAHAETESTGN